MGALAGKVAVVTGATNGIALAPFARTTRIATGERVEGPSLLNGDCRKFHRYFEKPVPKPTEATIWT